MDLRVTSEAPSPDEKAAVDSVLGASSAARSHRELNGRSDRAALGGLASAARRRRLLLPALHALQEKVGWISPPGLGYLCTRLDLPPAEAYGVASAYALFALERRPSLVIHVCDDIACRAAAGADPLEMVRAELESVGEPLEIEVHASPCLGHCEHGSVALVQLAGERGGRATLAPVTPPELAELARAGTPRLDELPVPLALVPQAGAEGTRLLRRLGTVEVDSLDSYLAHGGYEALRRALELGPGGVIEELQGARLLGRGGAAFPTGAKWEAVARNLVMPHYFVANADESEPGTFKDRVLLEHDPYAMVEALTIAGLATGSEEGFLYLRGEYPHAARRIEKAAAEARDRGLLGGDVMGSGARFDFEVRRGAGAYIAGEETALLNSIEGRRPEPRNKPPYPADRGLFGKPTGVNNVETLYAVLDVLTSGADTYSAIGTKASTGTRLFCLSGRISRPGLYEVAMGTTLRALIEMAGGVRDGGTLRAVLLGGAAGAFVGPDDLDLSLSFEGARAAGTTLGSGPVVVLDETVDMGAFLRRLARFFRDESCGQCVPCRVGTERQEEVLDRLTASRPIGSVEAELTLLDDLDRVMRDASICGLGQTASSAVSSARRLGLLPGLEDRPKLGTP